MIHCQNQYRRRSRPSQLQHSESAPTPESEKTIAPSEVLIKIKEALLDEAFAEAFECNPEMQRWLLSEGRFARFADRAQLLVDEQTAIRKPPTKNWWQYWWCRLPDGSESETDLFFVFEADGLRFALHIENKPPHGKLTLEQAAGYRRRAAFKANTPSWLDYVDFETILIAPLAFIVTNAEAADQFDRTISYERIAIFVSTFSDALRG